MTESLNLASDYNSPDHSTKGTRSRFNALSLLVSTRFQVLFHSPPGVLFTFPSRYCSAIGHQVVFRLGRWSSLVPTGFLVSGGTLDPRGRSPLSPTWFSHSVTGISVWPPPRSLATTCGISVDVFSWPYLDVSVQAVPHVHLCIQCTLMRYCRTGLPHSDISG